MRFNKSFLLVLCILFAFSALACQKSNSAKEQSAEQAERAAQEAEKMQAEAKAYNDAIKSEGELSPESQRVAGAAQARTSHDSAAAGYQDVGRIVE